MNTKTQQLNDLFARWEQAVTDYQGKFVKDGIVDERLYDNAPVKILFIAKEPNNPKQEAGDFREWWQKELAFSFSYRIAEWSFGLLNNFPQYDDIWAQEGAAINALHHIAFMNIKKTGGSANSDNNRMMEHLKMNIEFLHQQIDIISPNVIITGTSWDDLRNGLFPDVKWKSSGYRVFIGRHKMAKVISFYHPSSRNAPAASYSLLQNIVNSDQFKQL
ncbi:MAG: hypothetical protein K0B37_10250 [Bacteroidales bacterium]|nr:hypothetical protein [Bacteroidales bacterium]